MFRNTLAASLVLFSALLSISLSAQATPPEPQGGNPPVLRSAQATPPEPSGGNPPLATAN